MTTLSLHSFSIASAAGVIALLAAASAAPVAPALAAASTAHDQCFSDFAGYQVAPGRNGQMLIRSGRDLYSAQVQGSCDWLHERAGQRPYLVARARHFFCVGDVNDILASGPAGAKDRCAFVITSKLSPAQAARAAKSIR